MDNTDYKLKAFKYKIKYVQLKKKLNKTNTNLIGGIPEWFSRFNLELKDIYSKVVGKYGEETVLTGSGAIAFVLNYLGMEEDLDSLETNLINPHDLDFIYVGRIGKQNPESIGDFHINPRQITESSVTFSLDTDITNPLNQSNYIKSFDISKINSIKYFVIDGIRIINLNTLKSFYIPDFIDEDRKESDILKKNLIDKIIKRIYTQQKMNEFGFDEWVTNRNLKTKPTGLFGSEQKPTGLFGSEQKPTELFDSEQKQARLFDSEQKPTGLFGSEQKPARLFDPETPDRSFESDETLKGIFDSEQKPDRLFGFNDYESPIKKTTLTPQNNQIKSTNSLGPKNLFGDDN